ncbi:MAG: Flp pilus assembly complex ATPase component TadA [Planctomycetes bacterium]|nr:Flp pilus assembly complex ATPase component TadA [Planctomycetota bacterium]
MEIWVYNQYTDKREIVPAPEEEILIGRDESAHVPLRSPFISRRHARIFRADGRMFIESLGLNGISVRNEEVPARATVRLEYGDEIRVGEYSLYMMEAAGRAGRGHAARTSPRKRVVAFEQRLHAALLERLNVRAAGGRISRDDAEYVRQIKQHLDEIIAAGLDDVDDDMAALLVRDFLWRRTLIEVTRRCTGQMIYAYGFEDSDVLDSAQEDRVGRIVGDLISRCRLRGRPDGLTADVAAVEERLDELLAAEAARIDDALRRYMIRRMLHKEIEDVVLGFGPLQDLLDMPNVNEIMVVGKDHIYLEKDGVVQDSGRSFFSDEIVQNIIERIITPVGRRIDRSTPLVDARLPDGSRVNAIVNPLSLSGPVLTIRKFARIPFTIDDLIERDTLTERTAGFLKGCVAGRRNIIISGGTGSGKTTTLNVLGGFIARGERIVTIDDSAELQLPHEHLVRLETRPANIEGRGAYTIRDLVRNALRMRPNRLIVGECRGGEALDMLQAMNTGHDGSLTTIHANTPADTMARLETMVLMAVDMPVRAIREQILAAIDLVVQIARTADGRRRVTHISEVTGIDADTGRILIEDIFVLRPVPGRPDRNCLRHTGYIPPFVERMIAGGHLALEVFL